MAFLAAVNERQLRLFNLLGRLPSVENVALLRDAVQTLEANINQGGVNVEAETYVVQNVQNDHVPVPVVKAEDIVDNA